MSICERPFALEFAQSLGLLTWALRCCPLHEEDKLVLWSRNLFWEWKNRPGPEEQASSAGWLQKTPVELVSPGLVTLL